MDSNPTDSAETPRNHHPGILGESEASQHRVSFGRLDGILHEKHMRFSSAVHAVNNNAGMNLYHPMPFAERARFELTNESGIEARFYYRMDYTLGDRHPEEFGRMHVHFRRENPTNLKEDFGILPKRTSRGRYLGAVIGVRLLLPLASTRSGLLGFTGRKISASLSSNSELRRRSFSNVRTTGVAPVFGANRFRARLCRCFRKSRIGSRRFDALEKEILRSQANRRFIKPYLYKYLDQWDKESVD